MARCDRRWRWRWRFLYGIVVVVVVAVVAGVSAMALARLKLMTTTPIGCQHLSDATMDEKNGEHPRISYRELADATDGFSEANLVGKGVYGHVYRGVLHGGVVVAVKVLHLRPRDGGCAGSFERECRALRSIRHRNLIRVITACSTPDFKAVVLPFMPNGSLDGLIHPPPAGDTGGKADARRRLDLGLLLSIAGNVADGMAYLHHHAPFKIVHCDLKPSNVLLDDDMTAIVSDFGVSKVVARQEAKDSDTIGDDASSTPPISSSITRLLQGSVGYIAPEYGLGGNPSTRGDVYSFGVVLMEMVTGKRPTEVIAEEGHSLHEWVKSRLQSYNDAGGVGGGAVELSTVRRERRVVVELLELGVACSQVVPAMRPTMDDVAQEIACLKDGAWRKWRKEEDDDDHCMLR